MAEHSDDLNRLQGLQQNILDAAGDGIYGIDRHGKTIFGNAAATRILGWQTDEILGMPAHDVHHHSHADGTPYPREQCPIYAAIKDGKVHTEQDEVFWHTNGLPVPVEYTSTPIWRDGELDGAVVVFRDITVRKARKAEIRALKEQLERERDYLRDELDVTINFGEIVGESEALKRTLAQIEAVAATPATVLVRLRDRTADQGNERATVGEPDDMDHDGSLDASSRWIWSGFRRLRRRRSVRHGKRIARDFGRGTEQANSRHAVAARLQPSVGEPLPCPRPQARWRRHL